MPARISWSVLKPSTRPSRKTSVFTASPSASSQAATTACLCGIVTFAPAKPSARSAATAATDVLDVERGVVPVEAARGERGVLHARRQRLRDRDDRGARRASSTAVAVRALVLRERGVARREEVMHLVRLAHEVEVVDLRRMRGRLDRRQARGSRSASAAGPAACACCTGCRSRAATGGSTSSAGCAARSAASRRSRAACARAAGCRSPRRRAARSSGASVSFSTIDAMISTSYGVRFFERRVREVDLAPVLAERLQLLVRRAARDVVVARKS